MACPDPESAEAGGSQSHSLRPGPAPVIAVIEDDEGVRGGLEFALYSLGFAADLFASAAAFLAGDVSRYFCIITDQQMPGMTGLELVAHLRDNGLRLPALIVSADLSPEERRRADHLATAVLDKPFALGDLASFVKAAGTAGG